MLTAPWTGRWKERLLIRQSCRRVRGAGKKSTAGDETLRLDLKAADAAERRNALAMFYLELVSGIRKGELVALQWEDPEYHRKLSPSANKQRKRKQ